jgi:DUF971 family protein
MKQKLLPSVEYLNECLSYDPDSGVLQWKFRPSHHFKEDRMFKSQNSRHAYSAISTKNHYGYFVLSINGTKYFAHRIIYKMMSGKEPSNFIDHIDNVKSNNKWDNLRVATHSQNEQNRPVDKDNVSGYKGVTFHKKKKCKRYSARIAIDGTSHYLGIYTTPEEAHEAYKYASLKYHGDYSYFQKP